MNYFRNEKGFTLIELMVVILIIGILVAIAVPVFNAAKGNAEKQSCLANMRTVEGATETWKAGNADEQYPTTWEGLMGELVPDYIKKAPVCPTAGAGGYDLEAGSGGTSSPIIVCDEHGSLGDQ